MLTYIVVGFLIWTVLKVFEMGSLTRMVPQILLATMVHAPYLIGVVTGGSDKKNSGKGDSIILEKWVNIDRSSHVNVSKV